MALQTRPASKSKAGGVEIGIKVDERELLSILNELAHMPEELKKAERAAVYKTAKTGKTRTKQYLGKGKTGKVQINLQASLIADRIKVKMPKSEPVARIILSNRGYPLHWYGGLPENPPRQKGAKRNSRPKSHQASWKIYQDGPRNKSRGHFVQRDRRGEVHVFVRPPGARGGRYATAPKDYRIKYGPGIVSCLRERNMEDGLVLDLGDVLEKNLRNQVDRFLNRKKKDR